MTLSGSTADFLFLTEHPAITGERLGQTFRDSGEFFDTQLGRNRDDEVEIRRDYRADAQVEKIAERRAHHLAHAEEITAARLGMLEKDRDRLSSEIIWTQVNRQIPEEVNPAIAMAVAVSLFSEAGAMNETDLNAAYLSYAESGDVVRLAALEQGKMVDKATVARAREIVARRENPEKYAALEEYRLAISSIEGDLNRVRRELSPPVARRVTTEPLISIPVEDLVAS